MTDAAPAPLVLLDLDHLQAMTGGDQALAMEVLEIFKHQAEIWSRLLDPRADASQWADAAHTLKGASLGIGAIRLAAICGRAEGLGRADTAPSVTAAAVMLGDVKDALGDTLEAVGKLAYELAASGAIKAS